MKTQVAPESVSGSEREISRVGELLALDRIIWRNGHAWCPDCKEGVGCDRGGQPFAHVCPVEDMDLIALAHMSVEEAAAQLFSQPSVSAEEFRAFYEKLHSENKGAEKEAARLLEEQAHSWGAVDLAEEAQKEAELALTDEKKKTAALEIDVGVLEDRVAELEGR